MNSPLPLHATELLAAGAWFLKSKLRNTLPLDLTKPTAVNGLDGNSVGEK